MSREIYTGYKKYWHAIVSIDETIYMLIKFK